MGATAIQINLNYAAAAILRVRRHKLRILLMKVRILTGSQKGRVLWQLPGGGEEVTDQGNPLRTLGEELEEETGLRLRENYKDPELIVTVEKTPEHLQRFYLIWWNGVRGELRKQEIIDGNKLLGVPEWRTIDFAKKNLCDSHLGVVPRITKIDLKHKEWI